MGGSVKTAKIIFISLIFQSHLLLWVGVGMAQTSSDGSFGSQGKALQIPKEPGWKAPSYRGWELVTLTGLISTYYDLDLDGQLDYMVIRKIIKKSKADGMTVEKAIQIAQVDNLSVYFSHPVVYFANGAPLFYCLGLDARRNCKNIWIDIAEDGLNGNEELYTLSTPNPLVR
jgi:hypothetical protein